MKLISGRIGFVVGVALGLTLTMSTPARSGGSSDEEPHDHDDGPRYFGFVKDASGKIVPDAKVTAENVNKFTDNLNSHNDDIEAHGHRIVVTDRRILDRGRLSIECTVRLLRQGARAGGDVEREVGS